MSDLNSILEIALAGTRSRSSWNDRLWHWERPASDSEEGRIERAAKAAMALVRANAALTNENVKISPQGSYHNNTNVRLEADMDLRVQLPDIFICYGNGVDPTTTYQTRGYFDTGRTYREITDLVRTELVHDCREVFGKDSVSPGKKAVTVSGLSDQADVDLVPAFRLHWIDRGIYGGFVVTEGVAILSTEGNWTLNYPEQHHVNGKAKRVRTEHWFKKIVRMLKRLNYELCELGSIQRRLPSFLVECLVYCVEDAYFVQPDDRYDRVRRVLFRAQALLADAQWVQGATEVNGIKHLFHATQAWTLAEARTFVAAALKRLEV